MLLYLMFSLAVASATTETGPYSGFELLSVTPRSRADLQFLGRMFQEEGEIDVWQHPRRINESVLIMLPPNMLHRIKATFDEKKLEWSVASDDIDALARKSYDDVAQDDDVDVVGQTETSDIVNHNKFHNLIRIENYMKKFRRAYPNNVALGTIGETLNGSTIRYMKISTNASMGFNEKQSIMIEGGIHAREWISPASLMYFIDKMLQDYTNDQNPGRDMIQHFDWYIVLVANPDGYNFTHEGAYRYWRKNLRFTPCAGYYQYGVDGNRNFGYQYTINNCGETFAGAGAFSEFESRALRDFFNMAKDTMKAYLSIHSYAQAILVPWFYDDRPNTAPNNHNLRTAANLMYEYMARPYRNYFRVETVKEVFFYNATGSSVDWALSQKDSLIALSIELRPDYRYERTNEGFNSPTSDITMSGREVYAAFEGLHDYFY